MLLHRLPLSVRAVIVVLLCVYALTTTPRAQAQNLACSDKCVSSCGEWQNYCNVCDRQPLCNSNPLACGGGEFLLSCEWDS